MKPEDTGPMKPICRPPHPVPKRTKLGDWGCGWFPGKMPPQRPPLGPKVWPIPLFDPLPDPAPSNPGGRLRPYPKPWFDPEIDIGYRPYEGD